MINAIILNIRVIWLNEKKSGETQLKCCEGLKEEEIPSNQEEREMWVTVNKILKYNWIDMKVFKALNTPGEILPLNFCFST